MRFTSMSKMLQDAKANGYAVPGFNVFNMESLQAVVEVAQEEQAPVIVMAEQRDVLYAGMNYICHMTEAAYEEVDVPIALHLDHGNNLDVINQAIDRGFSSVMIDGSQLPFEDNIKVTAQVVKRAKEKGISVEAELGHVGGTGAESTGESQYTDPAVVHEFVKATQVDALAVAIGTAHGVYRRLPKLDFPRLEAIAQEVDIPLVLHGGSGTPDSDLQRAIELGVCKINIGTDIRRAFVAVIAAMGQDSSLDVRDVLQPAKAQMKEIIRDRIWVFGARNRA